jgi:1,4-alpha-glucan branching enzyme
VSAVGAFTFVLHSHLPYVRLAGRWPHGEEWIHEAASETYIPLLNTLYDLKADGVDFRLTLGITPILAEQLNDPLVLEHFNLYLDARIAAAEKDIQHFSEGETENEHLRYLAVWYAKLYTHIKDSFNNRFKGDIIGAFKQLQDEGYLELMASAATHAYLPLLDQDSTLNGQIKTGLAAFKRVFGKSPRAFWLPECAYRSALTNAENIKRPGLEQILAENDIKLFFCETHAITGGKPVGVAAGDVIGPYGDIKRRYVIPELSASPQRHASTYQAYYVANSAAEPGVKEHPGISVIGRNNNSGQQVWSADWGYPGDFDYREFHKKAGTSGFQYWRVTGDNVPLNDKDLYQPDWAKYKIDQHAEHFAHLVWDLLREYHQETDQFGIVASMYDTELFGHWWFEGVQWLGKVLRHIAENPEIEMTTASQYVKDYPPQSVLNLVEGSWGTGGTHFTWENGETAWMWPPIHEAERRMEILVQNFQAPTDDEVYVLNQAARELLLMQSSDWQFLVTTGQAREYAIRRFNQHLERFNKLADGLDIQQADRKLAEEWWEQDKVFPDIDYRWFQAT